MPTNARALTGSGVSMIDPINNLTRLALFSEVVVKRFLFTDSIAFQPSDKTDRLSAGVASTTS